WAPRNLAILHSSHSLSLSLLAFISSLRSVAKHARLFEVSRVSAVISPEWNPPRRYFLHFGAVPSAIRLAFWLLRVC
ncbi:hypothetical protein Taro_041760, partial [Colocasia esculenta]|nr:hypothetical protein [Colocasia esculenta]